MTNELYITIRDAIADASDERGRTFDPEHEAHYMALEVVLALSKAGYAIIRAPIDT